MIKKHKLEEIVVGKNVTILQAQKIVNRIGTLFVIDENMKLAGVVTDGDIRRSAIKGYNLDTQVKEIVNKNCFYVIEGTEEKEILKQLPKKVRCIPIVDREGILIDYTLSSEVYKKNVLITGITGQDGAYLAQLLLEHGYKVYGAYRRTSSPNFDRLKQLNIINEIKLISMDVTDMGSVCRAMEIANPTEVYNLAAQSFVETSFVQPQLTMGINAGGVANLLESIRHYSPQTKFYQASSSEMFGNVKEIPQTENTPFYPRSPYAVSKLAAHWLTVNYRESYGIFACSGILFNHESPLRGLEFVTRKISHGVAQIKAGREKELCLGNIKAKRDWGYAKDYVKAMWLMLQQNEPDDYVIATGKSHTVEEFARLAFDYVGLDYKDYIVIDAKYFRQSEVDYLRGDSSKAKNVLGWDANKTPFEELVKMMVEQELKSVSVEVATNEH